MPRRQPDAEQEVVGRLPPKVVRWERWRLAHDMVTLMANDGIPRYSESGTRLAVALAVLADLHESMGREGLLPKPARQ